ncbi:DUF2397 domain-containing protein [Actinoplanes sp. NPDC051494]|uniref:DUF2397 domain-containing protein n=1 Tax=Actinoplanes sp. NPDC051494 TaxID=3363907 RepID=UPI00378A06C8
MRPDSSEVDDDESRVDGLDLWQLAGLPGGLLEASYLTSRFAAQYRLIVDVLLAEQEHTLTGVAASELPGLLRRRLQDLGADPALLDDPGFRLKERMTRLERWGVVYTFQDKAVRDAEFVLDRDRYQLTETVAQLHRAITSLGDDTAAEAAATLAPGILTANLNLLHECARTDPAAAAAAWSVIATTHQSMVKAAASWQARLAGALAGPPTPEKITTVQETLRRYVDMWGAGIDTHSETITARAGKLAQLSTQVWRRVAVHTLGANADDPAIDALVDTHQHTLQTLQRWFDGPDCQARKLRRQMRDTIGPLLRGQRTLAAVGGHVSRRAELLDLAARLESAADDDAAWRLWCAATGLFAARHLPGDTNPPAGSPGAVSFWDADPVPIEARLRKQAMHELLDELFRLTGDEKANLKTLLDRTSLAAVIKASTGVSDRLTFLAALEHMVFHPEVRKLVKERSQLHRILENEVWIFGERFNLLVSDRSLDTVLDRHLQHLNRQIRNPAPVRRLDNRTGIVDLMLSRARKDHDRHQHLVVELKAPDVIVGHKEINQIQDYALAVLYDEQFADVRVDWDFWLITTKMSDFARAKTHTPDRPPGCIELFQSKTGTARVWLRSWSQVIDDCKERLTYFTEKFAHDPTVDQAMEYLHDHHNGRISDILIPAARPAPTIDDTATL